MQKVSTPQELTMQIMCPKRQRVHWNPVLEAALAMSIADMRFELCQEAEHK